MKWRKPPTSNSPTSSLPEPVEAPERPEHPIVLPTHMEIVQKLREKTVDQQISKGLTAAMTLARLNQKANTLEDITKALDTAEVGGGSEFVFTGMSPEVINQVRQ